MIDALLERPFRCRPKPAIPVQVGRNRVRALRAVKPLGPHGPVRPHVQLLRGTDDASLDDLDGAAQAGFGAALVAHLGRQVLFLGDLTHLARLVNRLDQRFLAEAVLAHLHGPQCGGAVIVVGSGDGHRVNILADFVQHLAVILVFLDLGELLGELLGLLVERVGVHVAHSNEIGSTMDGVAAVAVPLPAHANAGDVDAVVGAEHPAYIREGAGDDPRGQRGTAKKLTTSKRVRFGGGD